MTMPMADKYFSPEQWESEGDSEYQARCIATALAHMVNTFRGVEDAAEQAAKSLRQIVAAVDEMSKQSRRR